MTDDKKHDDKERKKVSDEEMKDVAGGVSADLKYALGVADQGDGYFPSKKKGKKKPGFRGDGVTKA